MPAVAERGVAVLVFNLDVKVIPLPEKEGGKEGGREGGREGRREGG